MHLKTRQKRNLGAFIPHVDLRGKNERNNHSAGMKCKNHGPAAVDRYGVLRNFQHPACTAYKAGKKQIRHFERRRYFSDEKNRQRNEPGNRTEQTKVSRTQAQSNSTGLFKQAYLGGTFHVFILTPPALTGRFAVAKSDM